MDLKISGKAALVAASSRGLGYAAALELAREGCRVSVCSRSRENIDAAAAELREATGAEILPLVADVADGAQIDRIVAETNAAFGGIDIVVTNAGGPPVGLFDSVDDAGWQRGFELTMLSTIRLMRAGLSSMKKQGWGRIVNILSISVKQPIHGLLVSNTLRPGLVGLTKSVADEVAEHGITINNVCPGWTATERVHEILSARAEAGGTTLDEENAKIVAGVPMQRMGEPSELAALIAFLCSDRASYITGATVQVDGGAYRGLM